MKAFLFLILVQYFFLSRISLIQRLNLLIIHHILLSIIINLNLNFKVEFKVDKFCLFLFPASTYPFLYHLLYYLLEKFVFLIHKIYFWFHFWAFIVTNIYVSISDSAFSSLSYVSINFFSFFYNYFNYFYKSLILLVLS